MHASSLTGGRAPIERARLRAALKLSLMGMGALAYLSPRARTRAFWLLIGASLAVGTAFSIMRYSVGDIAAAAVFGAMSLLILFTYDTTLAYVLLERRDRNDEIATATRIQQALYPSPLPGGPGCTAAAHHAPASALSGDYHDVIALPSGRWLILVADVAGKGVPAAILMSGLRTRLRTLAEIVESPAEIVRRLNVGMASESTACEYATLFLAVSDPSAGTLTWVDAGHQPGLLVRSNGTITRLDGPDLPVGMFPDACFTESLDAIAPGDRLVLFTDGVVDAAVETGSEITPDQLATAIVAHPEATAEGAVLAIRGVVREVTAGARGDDDITVLAVRF